MRLVAVSAAEQRREIARLSPYRYSATKTREASLLHACGLAIMPNSAKVAERLRRSGLRLTRQRAALAGLLFEGGDRHVSAEELFAEATDAHIRVSLATVYNTLNQFTAAGLLREVAIEGARTYFDTNTSNHCHYYFQEEARLLDIESSELTLQGLPPLPEGQRVERIDVIVRLCRCVR
jgi:Fur family iron response transcriptional regulator